MSKEESKKVNGAKQKCCKDPEDEKARKAQRNQERDKRRKLKKLYEDLQSAGPLKKPLIEQKIFEISSALNEFKENRHNKIWKQQPSLANTESDSFKIVDELDEKYNNFLNSKNN
uniref:BHLH domain-containing protein n=1 Tax=Panagrolaimus superbus TaxID=310955 RepID=A0A914YT09_9BILA